MLIFEYRIVLPISVEQYQVGQLYAVAEASKGETGGGDGVEVLENEPYENEENGKGQFTHKIYHLQSKVPGIIKKVAPEEALLLHEKAWNAYPYCKTVLTNPYMGEKFELEIKTWHKPDMGDEDNVHNLSEAEWKHVKVVRIDISKVENQKDYKAEEDPALFKSTKMDIDPLTEGWQEKLKNDTSKPRMCCYKLVKAKFKWMGLTGIMENLIQKFEKKLFTNFHRKLICSLDEWCELSMDDIRKIEEETKAELDEMRKSGTVKGTTSDN